MCQKTMACYLTIQDLSRMMERRECSATEPPGGENHFSTTNTPLHTVA